MSRRPDPAELDHLRSPVRQETGDELVSSSQRSLALLEYVVQADRPPSLMEIAHALGLPKATASRLCAQLVAQDWLGRDEARCYRAGVRLLLMSRQIFQKDRMQVLRHQALADLVAELGETCNLTVLQGEQVLYLDRVETHWPLRMVLDVGSLVPLHATASGKLFLAFMAPEQRRSLLKKIQMPALTSHTLTTAEDLERECESIRGQGHACDREEFLAGLIAVAVPVLTEDGRCMAAVAVHAPSARMPLSRAIDALPRLKAVARRLSAWL